MLLPKATSIGDPHFTLGRHSYILVGNPIILIAKHQGIVMLDGGLATTLENRGHDLNHELWSAKLLLEDPEAIRQAHLDFLSAGADCITTATYQATPPGF